MSNLVGQSQLADFRRHSTIVVNESDDTSVERSLRALVDASNGFCVRFVLLTYPARGATCAGYPR